MQAARLIVYGIELYGLIGLVLALWFASVGIGRALADPGHVTWGARLLMIPGTIGLWPYVLRRCLSPPR
jgi:hypothetical protein